MGSGALRTLVAALAGVLSFSGVTAGFSNDGGRGGTWGTVDVAVATGASPGTSASGSASLESSPSPGCGRRPSPGPTTGVVPGGDVVQALEVDGVTRSYRLAVPSRRRSSAPAPLVLLFHGSGSDAVQTSLYTRLPLLSARAGLVVATPDGLGGRWDLTPPDGHSADLDFVAALIRTLSGRYCIDPSRIDAVGISLGSEFAAVVGCTGRLRIAAIGLVAADFPLQPCRSPLPVIALHGTADPIVPYRHGATGAFLPGVPVPGTLSDLGSWAALNRCRTPPLLDRVASAVVRRTWTRCRNGSAVVLYTVVGGGHTWPGSPVTLSAGTFGPTTQQIDATSLMLHFFARHRLTG